MAKLVTVMDSDVEITTVREGIAWDINYRDVLIGDVTRLLSLSFVSLPFIATTYKDGYSMGQTAHEDLTGAVLSIAQQLGFQNEKIVHVLKGDK